MRFRITLAIVTALAAGRSAGCLLSRRARRHADADDEKLLRDDSPLGNVRQNGRAFRRPASLAICHRRRRRAPQRNARPGGGRLEPGQESPRHQRPLFRGTRKVRPSAHAVRWPARFIGVLFVVRPPRQSGCVYADRAERRPNPLGRTGSDDGCGDNGAKQVRAACIAKDVPACGYRTFYLAVSGGPAPAAATSAKRTCSVNRPANWARSNWRIAWSGCG